MFGLEEIIALNNGTAKIVPATIHLSTGAAEQRSAIAARDTNKADANAVQLARQNNGGWCGKCGSTSGHYNFCSIINGGYGSTAFKL